MAWTFGGVTGALFVLVATGILPAKVLAIGFLLTLFVIGPMLYILAAKFENWRRRKEWEKYQT